MSLITQVYSDHLQDTIIHHSQLQSAWCLSYNSSFSLPEDFRIAVVCVLRIHALLSSVSIDINTALKSKKYIPPLVIHFQFDFILSSKPNWALIKQYDEYQSIRQDARGQTYWITSLMTGASPHPNYTHRWPDTSYLNAFHNPFVSIRRRNLARNLCASRS